MTNSEINIPIFEKYLELLRLDLIANYDAEGLRASGKYEDELEAFVTENRMLMMGAHHSEYMENGRGKGYVSPKIIEDWIETKQGLPADMVENKKSVSYAIAYNINKNGIQVPNQYNRGKVISAVIDRFTQDRLPEMFSELKNIYVSTLKSDVARIFGEVY